MLILYNGYLHFIAHNITHHQISIFYYLEITKQFFATLCFFCFLSAQQSGSVLACILCIHLVYSTILYSCIQFPTRAENTS